MALRYKEYKCFSQVICEETWILVEEAVSVFREVGELPIVLQSGFLDFLSNIIRQLTWTSLQEVYVTWEMIIRWTIKMCFRKGTHPGAVISTFFIHCFREEIQLWKLPSRKGHCHWWTFMVIYLCTCCPRFSYCSSYCSYRFRLDYTPPANVVHIVVHERPLVAMEVHGRFRLGAFLLGKSLCQWTCGHTLSKTNLCQGALIQRHNGKWAE